MSLDSSEHLTHGLSGRSRIEVRLETHLEVGTEKGDRSVFRKLALNVDENMGGPSRYGTLRSLLSDMRGQDNVEREVIIRVSA